MEAAGCIVTCCLISLLSWALVMNTVTASGSDGDPCSIDCTFIQPKSINCECKCDELQVLDEEANSVTSTLLLLWTNPPQNCSADLCSTTCEFQKVLYDAFDTYEIELTLKNSNLEEVYSMRRSFSYQSTVRYRPPTNIGLKHPDPRAGTVDVVWSFPVDYPERRTYLRTFSYCIVRVGSGNGTWTTSQRISSRTRHYILKNLEPFSWYTLQVTCFLAFSEKLNWSHNVTFIIPGPTTVVKPLPTQRPHNISSSFNQSTSPMNNSTSEGPTQLPRQRETSHPLQPPKENDIVRTASGQPYLGSLRPTLGICGTVLTIVCLLAAVFSVKCPPRRENKTTKFITEFPEDTEQEESCHLSDLSSETAGPSICDVMLPANGDSYSSDEEIQSI